MQCHLWYCILIYCILIVFNHTLKDEDYHFRISIDYCLTGQNLTNLFYKARTFKWLQKASGWCFCGSCNNTFWAFLRNLSDFRCCKGERDKLMSSENTLVWSIYLPWYKICGFPPKVAKRNIYFSGGLEKLNRTRKNRDNKGKDFVTVALSLFGSLVHRV